MNRFSAAKIFALSVGSYVKAHCKARGINLTVEDVRDLSLSQLFLVCDALQEAPEVLLASPELHKLIRRYIANAEYPEQKEDWIP